MSNRRLSEWARRCQSYRRLGVGGLALLAAGGGCLGYLVGAVRDPESAGLGQGIVGRAITVESAWSTGRSSPLEVDRVALPTISKMGLVAPGEGWAANGQGLYLTFDNGAHWKALSPPNLVAPVVANLGAFASVGKMQFWVASSRAAFGTSCETSSTAGVPTSGQYSIASVAFTTDAGLSWNSSTLPGCGNVSELSFPDSRRGFALEPTAYPNGGTLFATSNGGATWRRVAPTPFQGPIDFTNPEDGWGISTPGGYISSVSLTTVPGVLYKTKDGGQTWQRDRLCKGAANEGTSVICGTPRFFGSNDGIVPAGMIDHRSGKDSFVVFSTRNGGRTWSVYRLPSDPSLNAYFSTHGPYSGVNGRLRLDVPFAASKPTRWGVFIGPKLYTTKDAGRHWTSSTPHPTFNAPTITSFDFASPTSGWIIARWSGPSPAFDYTTDAGKTWRPLARQ